MDFFDLAKLMYRWWFITVPLVALTLVGALVLSSRVDPEYTARGSMILVAPPGTQPSDDPAESDAIVSNPLLSQHGALPTTAYVTALSMNSPAVASLLASEGLSTSFDVAAETRLPIVLVEVRAGSRELATSTALRLVELIDEDLAFRQDAAVVPAEARVTAEVVSVAIAGGADFGGRTRMRIGIVGVGLVSTVGLVFLLEGLSRRRAGRGRDDDDTRFDELGAALPADAELRDGDDDATDPDHGRRSDDVRHPVDPDSGAESDDALPPRQRRHSRDPQDESAGRSRPAPVSASTRR